MKGCLIAVVVGIALIVAAMTFSFPKLFEAMNSAEQYANEVAPQVLSDPSFETLLEYGSIEMKAGFDENTREQFSAYVATNFGGFVDLKTPLTCQVQMGNSTKEKSYRNAQCSGRTEFEKSEGDVVISLVTETEQWRIRSLNLNLVFDD